MRWARMGISSGFVPMTVAQIFEEVKKLPSDEQADLIDMLLAHVRAEPNPEIEKAWDEEIAHRLEDLHAAHARLVSADEVFARARNALLSSRARVSKKHA